MIKGIGHIAYWVSDMEKSLNFYCDALGFKRAFDLKNDKGEVKLIYIKVADGQFIELFFGNPEEQPIKVKMGYNHLCLTVDNIYEIAEKMRKHGIPIDVEPKLGKDGNYQCWVKDPDGNRIEFMQIGQDSLQAKC